jgi:RNA polymerase sigma-70 factor (ECF subfamily)
MPAEATRLMLAAKRGDETAFDDLVERMRTQAFQVAHSLVGCREDALELSQEAFLKTYRARKEFRDGESFLPWFHRILRNTCYSFLRKRGRLTQRPLSDLGGSERSDDDTDWLISDDGPEPDARMEQDERARAFWSAFWRLSARDREILALRHFRDLPYLEIAETLDIPVGTVMSRLFHARRRLRVGLGLDFDSDDTDDPLATRSPPPSDRDPAQRLLP